MGGRAREWCAAKASKNLGLNGACDLLGRAGLALSLSVAAAPGGAGRGGLRRTGPALDADPRRVRRQRRRRLLRDPSGRGPARRRHLRDVPRAGEQPSARQPALRSEPLRAAAARLSRLHRHLPRADQDVPRQGRRVQSDRPAGRLWRLPELGEPGRAASARSATGRSISPAIFSKLAPVRFRRLGRARMGMRHQASRGGRARRRAVHRAHIIRVTEKAFDDFAAAGTDQAANRKMLGLDR